MSFRVNEHGLLVPEFNIQVPKIIPRGHNLRRLMKEDYGTLVGAKPPSAESYSDKVNALGPIAYWRKLETSGTTADNYEGTAARDATYERDVSTMGTGTGIEGGDTAPIFTPGSDFVDISGASFEAAWDGLEGSLGIWLKIDADAWADSTLRRAIRIRRDGSNYVMFDKTTTANRIDWTYSAGGTTVGRNRTSVSTTDWFHMGITWSDTADEARAYFDGILEGSAMTPIGVWSGNPNNTQTGIGAGGTNLAVGFDGLLAHCTVFDTVLSAADMLSIATVP